MTVKIEDRVQQMHHALQRDFDSLRRIAVAIYDANSGLLKTFFYSSERPNPLALYEAKLSSVPSLAAIAESGEPRVVDDLHVFASSGSHHSQQLLEHGMRSSYTVPIYDGHEFFGFLFYNSTEESFFSPAVLLKLRLYTDLIALLVVHEMRPVRTLRAAAKIARGFAAHRDPETGNHLERMSRYARLIAKAIAPTHGLADDYVELVFQLSPLHDVGKIAVPDSILLKAGKLDDDEFEQMKSHVPKGLEIVDMLVTEFDLGELEYGQMLRNIVAGHHENIDGSGYPAGLAGAAIPLEARITRVADVFDALTSDRPYKSAWSNEAAIANLLEQTGSLFDGACVDGLVASLDEVSEIQRQFEQDIFG